jgi:hypothetical protein
MCWAAFWAIFKKNIWSPCSLATYLQTDTILFSVTVAEMESRFNFERVAKNDQHKKI